MSNQPHHKRPPSGDVTKIMSRSSSTAGGMNVGQKRGANDNRPPSAYQRMKQQHFTAGPVENNLFKDSIPADGRQDPYQIGADHAQASNSGRVHQASDGKRRNAVPASGTEKTAAYSDMLQNRPMMESGGGLLKHTAK